MDSILKKNNFLMLQILALSFFIAFALFIWQGNIGFNLWDEGFLWYGVQRVMLGEVPIRDFMAYDPGRYYWSAAVMSILGDNSIMSLRIAATVFQAFGLFAGLLLVTFSIKSHGKESLLFLIISAMSLVVWMSPYQRFFDISLSIFLIAALTFLIQNPCAQRYFVTGICVGLIAIFGRNHGVYGVVASLGAIAWLSIRPSESLGFIKGVIVWALGVIAGFSPILVMGLFIPGFADAFFESVRFLFELKATNLVKPIPWPWTVDFSALPTDEAIRQVLVGIFFIAILIFGVVAIIWVVFRKFKKKQTTPALVAVAFLALPYAHYAYSRADLEHLSLGIFPFILGCLLLLSTRGPWIKWSLVLGLCAASFWAMQVSHDGWRCHQSKVCVDVEISGRTIKIDPRVAKEIALLRSLVDQYAPNGQSFIATPLWPGAYPLFERRSPMWEIYALFHRPESFERKEIERIKESAPGFAIIFDLPLDGRDDLRFRNTHKLIYQYIVDNFEQLPNSPDSAFEIYRARNIGP